MTEDFAPTSMIADAGHNVPAIIGRAGEQARRRFIEFYAANIRNKNTRLAYAQAHRHFFAWCEAHRVALESVQPAFIGAYIERLQATHAPPSVKQHLAAIRMLFDWFVVGQVLPSNPASSVRGPRHVVKQGKTPVLTADQARSLLDSIDLRKISGMRDRALIGVMVYSFARVGAVVAMKMEDYFQTGKRWSIRLYEKGGKRHHVPCHHNAEAYLDAYVEAAGLDAHHKLPLFRSMDSRRQLTDRPMHRLDVLRMIKRRAKAAGLPATTCCHTFRATGITVYIENGGTIEKAQTIAAHESPRTTKLYDRSSDEITLDEVERIVI